MLPNYSQTGGDQVQREWLTEYEWRTRTMQKRKKRPDWWGAQCVYPTGIRRCLRSRSVRLWSMAAAIAIAAMLPVVTPAKEHTQFEDLNVAQTAAFSARSVNDIAYELPREMQLQKQVFSRSQLLGGKMLMINHQHPLPDDLPPPNTASIALRANGMVPVHSLQVRSGYETIHALQALFEKLRSEGADGLYIRKGTVSRAQQKQEMLERTRALMQDMPIHQAVGWINQQLDSPGTGSLMQEYAVEMGSADGKALESSPQGQKLLQLCWRYGFVRETAERPFRFRYTGRAHAAAITYLALELEEYLEWMHQKGKLVIYANGQPRYAILCVPMQGDYAAFDLPTGAEVEVSMDNLGYALAACVL